MRLPEPVNHLNLGLGKHELICVMRSEILVIDARKKSIRHKWKVSSGESLNCVYWRHRNAYIATSTEGDLEIFVPGKPSPVATAKVGDKHINDVVPLDANTFATSSVDANQPVVIWNTKFDEAEFSRARLVGN